MKKKTGIDTNIPLVRVCNTKRTAKAIDDLLEAIELDTVDTAKEDNIMNAMEVVRTMHELMIATNERINKVYLARWNATQYKLQKAVLK